jgi:hypothetical protein
MKNLIILLVIVMSSLLYPAGKNWYISNISSGTASGDSWANKRIISSFNWSQAQPGDTIFIDGGRDSLIYDFSSSSLPGLYPGGWSLSFSGTSNAKIVITRGKDKNYNGIPIFLGGRASACAINASVKREYIEISYLKFRNGAEHAGVISIINANNIDIFNNIIEHPRGTGIGVYYSNNFRIMYNDIRTGIVSNSYNTDGIHIEGAIDKNHGGAEIAFNTIVSQVTGSGRTSDAHKDVVQTSNWQLYGGLTKIHHNLFVQSPEKMSGYGSCVNLEDIGGHWEIYNNVFVFRNLYGGNILVFASKGYKTPSTDTDVFAKIFNNSFYMTAHGNTQAPCFYGIDSLQFKNNIVLKDPSTSTAAYGLLIGGDTEEGYMDIDYNQYYTGDSNDFIYYYPSGQKTWAQWRNWNTFGSNNKAPDQNSEWKAADFMDSSGVDALDFSLKYGSAGIDGGTSISLFSDDYTGAPRPQGSGWDRGAFEFKVNKVGEDVIAPELQKAAVIDSVTINLSFSESLDESSTSIESNFIIDNGIEVYSSSLSSDGKEVKLSTSIHSVGQTYNILTMNIKDRAGNLISEDFNKAQYAYKKASSPGLVKRKIKQGKARDWYLDYTPDKSIDGKTNSDPTSRWGAASPMPDTIYYELEEPSLISQTRISFYNWEGGREYKYKIITSEDNINWNTSIPEAWSESSEWSILNFDPVMAKHIQVISIENNQSIYAGIWESEVWGFDSLTEIETEEEVLKPETFELLQNYPNPFNPSTKIVVQLAQNTNIRLAVYNVLGELVRVLADTEYAPGKHEFNFDARGLTSGVYIYRVESSEFVETKKMILLQ